MEYRKLGTSGITVSAVAIGCWAFAGGSYWGRQDEAEAVATIRAAENRKRKKGAPGRAEIAPIILALLLGSPDFQQQ